ncbi:MAG TPA: bifunctional diaminohydroxyphosphoribosylaminopyrimidine deaminase/5-amino-6-(5-phosphoribosylamino)uracil reductase RibD [Chitinophagales bacterium]|nr:bifunctional diaminohydroxyphosphoribosylaminopyrimidine deaminase/5-amino-6-(5-phosphoribosylamino)uracil reductase RibD [Chitinophagales bacterium]
MNQNNTTHHEQFMRRCFQLAMLGTSYTAPNPMVGAVLVYKNRIIGEGYHAHFGAAHAEVNCINSVQENDKKHIAEATLYVSLEPCAHHGKTPPCADLILKHNIQKVVISVQDNYNAVNGKGIERLRTNGVEVTTGILETEGKALLKHFLHFNQYQQPYITLKFAQTADGFIGIKGKQLQISNELSKRYVHHLRATHQAILVGKNTIISDNPTLDVRHWNGRNPTRIILGNDKNIPANYNILNKKSETIFLAGDTQKLSILEVMHQLHAHSIISVLVEGGASVLQQFIQSNFWNEAHIISSKKTLHEISDCYQQNATKAPELLGQTTSIFNLENDTIQIIKNTHAIPLT